MNTIRVLIADDHEVVRLGLQCALEGSPHITVIGNAESGYEAIRLARELRPDIVLMDIRMPGLNGIEACRDIVLNRPDTKVIMLTSYPDETWLFAAIGAGAAGYLLKSSAAAELVRHIKAVATGNSVLDHAMTRPVLSAIAEREQQREAAVFEALTPDELKILALIEAGLSNSQIGQHMIRSVGTIRKRVSSIFGKLKVANRTQAAAFASQHSLTDCLPRAGQ
jgi:DNA-binding NarL/FixJ family response regulator